jgi:hypothetical protein
MKKENLIIGAIAVFGALTLFNTYTIFSKKNRTVPTYNTTAQGPANNQGPNFPNTNPQNNFQNTPQQQPAAAPVVPAGPTTSINFKSTRHEFGKVVQNTTNKYTFEFTNTGTEPLIISNAKGSCGCTVPVWPKEAILPGETGEIKVEYKPGLQSGNQTKTVTVTANTDPAISTLQIAADVQVDPNAPKPAANPNQPGASVPFEGGTVEPM